MAIRLTGRLRETLGGDFTSSHAVIELESPKEVKVGDTVLMQTTWCKLGRYVLDESNIVAVLPSEKPEPVKEIAKMPHFGYDLANKKWEVILQNIWDKLNEQTEVINKLLREGR
jgi:hypothetical protein